MQTLLIFAVTLFLAVLVSCLASRSVLSVSVLFLAVGFCCSKTLFGLIDIAEDDRFVDYLAEFTLFAVLFNDGMRVSGKELCVAWHLPGRALLIGLPLSLVITALLCKWLLGLNWIDSWLIGAALAPTDPVFASALIGRRGVPLDLRRLLNVESGLNDGIALPIVMVLLAISTMDRPHYGTLGLEVVGGIWLGIVIPWLAVRLEQSWLFRASPEYRPLNAVAIGLILLALADLTHANKFLAAFAGGVTLASVGRETREAFSEFGEIATELLKLGTLLIFGALISPALLADIHWYGYVWATLVIVVARPLSLYLSLLGNHMPRPQKLAAAWFGPKGFASVVYGLLILYSTKANGDHLFHLIAIVVVISIVAHSSTDALVGKWLDEDRKPSLMDQGQKMDQDGT